MYGPSGIGPGAPWGPGESKILLLVVVFCLSPLEQTDSRVRVEVGHTKPETGPQRRIGSIGGIGPKKGSMAKIGKGQKRAPETS